MPIVVNLDVMMARRHKAAGELAEEIGITPANLSILKNNKAKAGSNESPTSSGALQTTDCGTPTCAASAAT